MERDETKVSADYSYLLKRRERADRIGDVLGDIAGLIILIAVFAAVALKW